MFFVHPQIRFNNIGRGVSCLNKKPDLERLNRKLSSYFPNKQFIFTDMGRTAFKLIIEKLNLQNSQILFPAYICDIFYPIFKQYNIKPIFLDIDLRTFHIKTEEIKQKITSQTKAILICHTYGLPIDVSKIREIVGNDIIIIEDCAHSFGGKVKQDDSFVGNSGDVSFFSLYKQFPCLRGGLLVCPQDWRISLPKTSLISGILFLF